MERDTRQFDRWRHPPRTNPDRRERTPERRTLEGQLDMSWQLDAGRRLRRLSPLSSPSGCGLLLYRGRYRLPLACRCQPVRLGHPASGRLCAKRHPAPRPERVDLTRSTPSPLWRRLHPSRADALAGLCDEADTRDTSGKRLRYRVTFAKPVTGKSNRRLCPAPPRPVQVPLLAEGTAEAGARLDDYPSGCSALGWASVPE